MFKVGDVVKDLRKYHGLKNFNRIGVIVDIVRVAKQEDAPDGYYYQVNFPENFQKFLLNCKEISPCKTLTLEDVL